MCLIVHWFVYDGTFFKGQKPKNNSLEGLVLLIVGALLSIIPLIISLREISKTEEQ